MEEDLPKTNNNSSAFLSHLPGLGYRCKFDENWTMEYISEGCFELTGYYPEDLLYNKTLSYNDLIAPEYRDTLWKKWEALIGSREPFKHEYEIITEKGKRKWVLEIGKIIFTDQGEVDYLEGIILDISEKKIAEKRLIYQSEHDTWTGLHNRSYLEDLLKKDGKSFIDEKRALISINLDSIHFLVRMHGFQYTQDLIKKIAKVLKRYISKRLLLFKTYENRFVFYIKNYIDKEEIYILCKNILNDLEYILLGDRVDGAIGVIEIDKNNYLDIDLLLKRLLITSEKAIETCNTDYSICFYDSAMETIINREEIIEWELAQFIINENDDRLYLLFQPILDLRSKRICSFEALARLKTEKLGLVSPLEFIPIAERTKLIIPIGQRILKKAFEFQKELEKEGYKEIIVSINISIIELLRNDFVEKLITLSKEMAINPKNICLEITESVFASDFDDINNIINVIKSQGFNIALDDFGTGYSSLARENELDIDYLKIDKLINVNPSKAILSDIISMVHKLGHIAIAEGVENKKQMDYLLKNSCDKIQGYIIGKPGDFTAAIKVLEENK